MKNAKKSMFITTILMVAVLIVAVSTATFAWYTASNQGTASNATLVAANSSSANIAVGWTEDATTTGISFYSKTISPAVPKTAPVEDMKYDELIFQTATLNADKTFSTVADYNDVWEANSAAVGTEGQEGYVAAGNQKKFYVINHNVNNATTVTMTCNIGAAGDDNNNGRLVIAVFVDDELAGIFTNLTEYYVGTADTLKVGQPQSGMGTSTVEKVAGNTITFGLEAKTGGTDHYAMIQVKAWLDGQELTQNNANDSAAFDFIFNAQ